MRLAGINPTSLFDGVGVNFVVFFQGCKHHCPHCHNPSTWDFNGGVEMSFETLRAEIEKYMPLITGITFSGGDPVYQPRAMRTLAEYARARDLTVTLYTGFTFEQLRRMSVPVELFDYIIDGRFEIDKSRADIPFRGSSNQNIRQRTPEGWRLFDGSARRQEYVAT